MSLYKRLVSCWIIVLLIIEVSVMTLFAASQKEELISEEKTTAWQQTFQKIQPIGWAIEVKEQSYPLRHNPSIAKGIEFRFKGTQNANYYNGLKGKEEFTLWLMPSDYKPEIMAINPAISGTFSRIPEHLGSNGTYQVYCLTTFSYLPSWPTWQDDIRRVLKIDREKTQSKPIHVPCQDISKCSFLGTMKTSAGPVYILRIAPEDHRDYYVRSGDFVGEYIVTQIAVSGGKEKLILKKDENEVAIQRTHEALGSALEIRNKDIKTHRVP
ncbi:MAG: hypothetical protein KJ964_01795 [Verrucomicrobia bacterium]|nr:hypothetical protein [Verrucomicrobiota bacterium]MBU1857834.1 hypothetical protein [Verrucomicrobiota bacterium]